MAVSQNLQGYQCEFIDSVPDDFYCKKCSLVARKLTFTSCCGESYCHTCIADIQQQDKPCPDCGQQNFNIQQQIKYQRRVGGLQVYCSMRGRGCDWSGTVEQLDAHLDPDGDNCQHVDINCPLNCQQTIPKNKVEQHMANDCVKRDFICQYCAFKATYKEVVDTHWPKCIYFPLQCPNLCGVTCERDVMEDHMRICRLEKVACEFSGMGCDGRFRRENQEEHTRQNTQKHLTLIAAAGVKTNQQLKKLQEHEKKLQEQEQKLQEQEQKLQAQEKKLQVQEQKLQAQQLKLQAQEMNLQKQEEKFQKLFQEEFKKKLVQFPDELSQNEASISPVNKFILKRSFFMKDFSKEKEKDRDSEWKSPVMYTHLCGYKFCIGIDANGYGDSLGKAMRLELWPLMGEYDYNLKWPADASFTIELINPQGGANWKGTSRISWWKPKRGDYYNFENMKYRSDYVFIFHSKLKNYLSDDTLYFYISDITVF